MLPLAPNPNTGLRSTCRIGAKMELNGHKSSFRLGTSTAATLNFHCKIMMNQEDFIHFSSCFRSDRHISKYERRRWICFSDRYPEDTRGYWWCLMITIFLSGGLQTNKTVFKRSNNGTETPKPTGYKLEFSIEGSKSSLSVWKKYWNPLIKEKDSN